MRPAHLRVGGGKPPVLAAATVLSGRHEVQVFETPFLKTFRMLRVNDLSSPHAAWYGLALCLIRLRRFDDAVVALRKNTELQPMSPYGWYQLARVQMDRQQPDEALKIIRHLRKFEPKVADQLERETGLVST